MKNLLAELAINFEGVVKESEIVESINFTHDDYVVVISNKVFEVYYMKATKEAQLLTNYSNIVITTEVLQTLTKAHGYLGQIKEMVEGA